MKNITLYISLLLLAGCAAPQTKTQKVSPVIAEIEAEKQMELAMATWLKKEQNLYRIGYPILERGTALCQEGTRHDIGIVARNNRHFNKEWQDFLSKKYGFNDLIQVVYISPGSPADQAGVMVGDIPLSINDWDVPVGKNANQEFSQKLAEIAENNTIVLTVRRAGIDKTMRIAPKEICAYHLVLQRSDVKNAYADGKRIIITTGMMDFFDTDEEAALVIAHELAHNAMKHIDAKKQNIILGGAAGLLLDLFAQAHGVNTQGGFTEMGAQFGSQSYSVEFEQEADYVGLYLMALAGYDISDAANFWRRMAIQNPESIKLKFSHPTTPERFIAIEQTIKEINDKKAAGLPLQPDYKERNEAAQDTE